MVGGSSGYPQQGNRSWWLPGYPQLVAAGDSCLEFNCDVCELTMYANLWLKQLRQWWGLFPGPPVGSDPGAQGKRLDCGVCAANPRAA